MSRPNTLDGFGLQRFLLGFSGSWPRRNPSWGYRLRNVFVSWALCLGVVSCMVVDAIYHRKDFSKLTEIFYIFISWVCFLFRMTVFAWNAEVFHELVRLLEDGVSLPYPREHDGAMEKAVRFVGTMARAQTLLYMVIAALFSLYPIMDNRLLPFPFPYELGSYRWPMYAFQVVGEIIASTNCVGLDTTCTGLMSMVTTHLSILCERIRGNKDGDVHVLQECVVYHMGIIRMVELIEDIFSSGMLFQFMASILVYCNTLFALMWMDISWMMALMAFYFMGVLTQLFMYCWFGNEILIKSKEVSTACYMSKWTNYDTRARRYLFIMMERTKKPLQVTTMKFSVLSLPAFLSILQWSYSFLALILNMVQTDK